MNAAFFLALLLYAAAGTGLALFSRRYFRRDIRDYYVTSGRLGGAVSALTYAATTYSAFMMLGLVGLAYATGAGALGFELAYLASTAVLLSTAGYRVHRLSRERGWVSPSQMLADMYGSRALGVAASLVYLYAMLPYLAAQVLGLRIVFGYGGLGEAESLAASALLVYAWIAVAGMWSVALTNLLQGSLMLFGGLAYLGWLLLFFTPSRGLTPGRLLEDLGSAGYLGLTGFWTPSVFLAYTIPWVFFAVSNPQVVAKLYLPRSGRAYRETVAYFFAYGLLYTLVVVAAGLAARGLAVEGVLPEDIPRDNVTPTLLGYMDPALGSVVAVSIIAATVDTANSIVLAVSSSVATTLGARSVNAARALDAALVAAATAIAALKPGFIVDLSVLTSVILLPVGLLTLVGAYTAGERSAALRYGSLASLLAGAGLATYYAVALGPRRAFTYTVAGLPVSGLVAAVSGAALLASYAAHRLSRGSPRRP
ncbi:sodium:solute symporter family protein [Thermogladius sp. KZ2Tp1]|uniref:sodium:solute symporter family transporter n=1 Tax=Thermogladius sp. KZ2Tp1 TaxID=3136289 RepID=UPI003DA97BEB